MAVMDSTRLIAYDLQSGVRLARLHAKSVTWSHSWNEAGGMTVTLLLDRDMAELDVDSLVVEQRTAIALWLGDRIVHAGPVMTAPEWNPADGTLSVSVGGGLSQLEWLPAMDSRLRQRWLDGQVIVDEDNPEPGFNVGFGGSGGDLVKAWIGLAQQWADRLRVNVPIAYSASHTDLTAACAMWDFKTVADMITQTVGLEHGGQVRFDPQLDADGRLQWECVWQEDGIRDHWFKWNPGLPGQRVRFTGVAAGSLPAVTDSWATGGKNDDSLLITRQTDSDAISRGWPLIFKGDTSSGSSDSLAALHATARNNLNASRRDRTFKLSCGVELDPRVGDWIDLRVEDAYLHERLPGGGRVETLLPLVVTDVSGDASSDWVDVQCRQRADSIDGLRPGAGDPMSLVARRMANLSRGVRLANAATGTQAYGTTGKVRSLLNSETYMAPRAGR